MHHSFFSRVHCPADVLHVFFVSSFRCEERYFGYELNREVWSYMLPLGQKWVGDSLCVFFFWVGRWVHSWFGKLFWSDWSVKIDFSGPEVPGVYVEYWPLIGSSHFYEEFCEPSLGGEHTIPGCIGMQLAHTQGWLKTSWRGWSYCPFDEDLRRCDDTPKFMRVGARWWWQIDANWCVLTSK